MYNIIQNTVLARKPPHAVKINISGLHDHCLQLHVDNNTQESESTCRNEVDIYDTIVHPGTSSRSTLHKVLAQFRQNF